MTKIKMKLSSIFRRLRYIKAILFYFFSGFDKIILENEKYKIASRYLKNKYVLPYYKKQQRSKDIAWINNESPSKRVWIYWRQGRKTMPPIVKKCIESITYTFEKINWEVTVLDITNIQQYVSIPLFLWEKYKKGIISDAHFSDILRLILLTEYGGCWIDATVLLTGNLPSEVGSEALFLYSNDFRNNDYINISNWLISSAKGHPILQDTYNILINYWKKENVVIQYYMFHFVFKFVTDYYCEYWKNQPFRSNIEPHLLQHILKTEYDEKKWNHIKSLSTVHKLYWDVKEEFLNKNCYYFHLIQND